MAKDVFINLEESLQLLWPLGLTVGHQESDERLTVRPPQLHAPLQLLRHTGRIRQHDLMHFTKLGDAPNAHNIYNYNQNATAPTA